VGFEKKIYTWMNLSCITGIGTHFQSIVMMFRGSMVFVSLDDKKFGPEY
jgi:hypothetical protein